jgi:hypothetical protein
MFGYRSLVLSVVPSSGGDYESETTALLARFGGSYDSTRQSAINTLIKGLKDDGLWSTIDVLQIYAANTSADALLNWKSTSFTGTTSGSPTFTTDRGFLQSSSSWIDTGYNPSSGSSYSLNSATIGIWSRTNGTDGNGDCGAVGGSTRSDMYIRFTDDNFYGNVNHTTSSNQTSASNTNATGLFVATRTSSTASKLYRNGSSLVSRTEGTSGVPNLNVFVGRRNGGDSVSNTREYALFVAGSGWDDTQSSNFHSRINTYFTAIGV